MNLTPIAIEKKAHHMAPLTELANSECSAEAKREKAGAKETTISHLQYIGILQDYIYRLRIYLTMYSMYFLLVIKRLLHESVKFYWI